MCVCVCDPLLLLLFIKVEEYELNNIDPLAGVEGREGRVMQVGGGARKRQEIKQKDRQSEREGGGRRGGGQGGGEARQILYFRNW